MAKLPEPYVIWDTVRANKIITKESQDLGQMKKIEVNISEIETKVTKSYPTGNSNNVIDKRKGWGNMGYILPKDRKDIKYKTMKKVSRKKK